MTPPITRDGDGVFVDSDGVKRRTILAGAAWSIPVISMATATPAFAATNDLKLEFNQSSYSGEGCKTIDGVKVTATRNGVAQSGESVTVTLADGYTFEDGSTSYTDTTGSDGAISLPKIKVPGKGGNSTFSASGGGASASAPVSGTPSGQVYQSDGTLYGTDQPTNLTGIQSTKQRVWGIDSDKNLWAVNAAGDKWSKVTGATDVSGYSLNDGGAVYLKSGRVYQSNGDLWGTDQPATFTRIQDNGNTVWAIDSDKTLWQTTGGDQKWTKITNGTNVSDFALDGGGYAFLKAGSVYDRDGKLYGTDQPSNLSGLQTTGVRVWAIDSDKTLWAVNGANEKWEKVTGATNVSAYSLNDGGAVYLKDGKVYQSDGSLWGTDQPGTLTTIKDSGNSVWALDSDGTLWQVSGGDKKWSKVPNGTAVRDFAFDDGGAAFLKNGC